MALTDDAPIKHAIGDYNDVPAAAAATLYEGGAVGDNASGYARALTAGDPFLGHAISQCDNSAGAAGAKEVRVLKGTYALEVTLSGVAITDVGKVVYMSDDATYTQTAGSNTKVGKIVRYVSANTCIVQFTTNDVLMHEHTGVTNGGKLTSPRIVTAITDTNGKEEITLTATAAAVNEITLANAATGNAPTITASGDDTNIGLTIACKGTGDLTLTGGSDALLRSGTAASDLVGLRAYDVDASAYDTLVQATAGNTPILTLQGDGGIVVNAGVTLSNAAGTGAGSLGAVAGQDITITAGNDLALQSGTAASDLLRLQAYDVDASAYDSLVTLTAGNTPTLAFAADGGIGFFGVTAATQRAHIADPDTNATNITAAVASINLALETIGFVATA